MQATTHLPEMRAVDELSSLIIAGVFGGLIDSEETRRTRRLCTGLIDEYQTLTRLRLSQSSAAQISRAEQCVVAAHTEAIEMIAHLRDKLSTAKDQRRRG